MSKHTPGPWIYYTSPQPNGRPIVGHNGLMVAMLAHSVNYPGQKEVATYNARLIAAAPDLLAACQAMAEWDAAENQLPPYDSDNGASFDKCMALCRDAFDKARAAIAKATGEQS